MQGSCDGGVAACPVGHQKSDILFAEGGLDIGVGEGDAFIDLAGQAPGGGEIDEDCPTGLKLAGDFLFRPGEPIRVTGSKFGGAGFEGRGRDQGGEKNQGQTAPAQGGRWRKGALGFAEEEKSEAEEKQAERNGWGGGGSRQAEGDPNEPEDGGQHGEGENFFEGVHP